MVKLIVHIGHGKTGSSSIQKTLKNGMAALDSAQIRYLGLMLEHACSGVQADWQKEPGSDRFFDNTPVSQAQAELSTILDAEFQELTRRNYALAIWSNEWIMERPEKVLPVLKSLSDQNVDIEIQAYLRRHDKWTVSAYTQWGLRHKTYEGPVIPFKDWVARRGKKFARYYETLLPWLDAFGDRLRIMNFDAAGDVAEHFLRVNGISGIPVLSDNVSPPPATIMASAVYNSAKTDKVRTAPFDRITKLVTAFDETGREIPPLDQLMPDADILRTFIAERSDDIEKVNALLAASNEPPLSFDSPARDMHHPSPWEMDQMLLKYVFGLSEELFRLRHEIAVLRKQVQQNEKKP